MRDDRTRSVSLHRIPERRMHVRRGSVYVAVLGTSMIVSLLAITALTIQRITRRAYAESSDMFQARLNAQTALRLGMLRIEQDPDWRYTFSDGVWQTDSNVYGSGAGTYSIVGQDPTDGDLKDSPSDPLVLMGIGKKGNAIQKVKVTLVPQNRPLSCLEAGMHSGGNMTFDKATLNFNGTISTNDSVDETGTSSIDANAAVEAVNTITGDDFAGTTTTGVTAREMPSSATAFDYYKNNGTWIDINDIVLPPSPLPAPPPPNLLFNPSIETGLAPWEPWLGTTCTVQRETATKHTGLASLLITGRTGFQAGPVQDISTFVQSGVTYYCEAWVYMKQSSANAHLTMDVSSSGEGAQWWLGSDINCTQDQWVLVSATLTPTFTGTVTSATLKVETKNGDPVGDFNIDDVVMKEYVAFSGDNLVKNSEIEFGTTDWHEDPAWDIANDTSAPHGGAGSLKCYSRALASHGARQDITNNLQNNVTYDVQVWVKMASGSAAVKVTINTFNGTEDRWFNNSDESTFVGTNWTLVQRTLTPNWSGSLVSAYLAVETASATTDLYVDDVVMKAAPTARTIYRAVLSPNSNPYGTGTTNAQGIYVIDCLGQDIHVQASRIVGTLVLLNPAVGSSIRSGPVNWAPAVSNFPALMVDGNFEINPNNGGLNETSEWTNFNPTGTPDAALSPTQDSDTNDTYASEIKGIIYASGNLTFQNHPVVNGVVVSDGTSIIKDTLDLTHQQMPAINPPPGFNNPEEIRLLLKSATKVVD